MISYTTWEAIAETPWYIYFLIWVLFYLGYLSTKPRLIRVKPEIASQTFSIAIFITALIALIPITLHNFSILIGGSVVGCLLGYAHFYFGRISALRDKWLVFVPGSYSILVIVTTLVLAKYYFYGHRFFISIEIIRDPRYLPIFMSFSGLAIGLFLGRMYYLLRCVKSGPFFEGELPPEFAKLLNAPALPRARGRKKRAH